MGIAVLATLILATQFATAQIVTVLPATNAEYEHLFERVARSAVVVTGKVVDRKAAFKRDPPGPVVVGPNLVRGGNPDEVIGGSLFTIEIGEPICRQQDFTTLRAQTVVPEGTVQVFVPYDLRRDSDVYPGIRPATEQLFKGGEFLLFLIPHSRQNELVSNHVLDPSLIYYRAFDGFRGAYELPDVSIRQGTGNSVTRYMGVVKSFCEAVKPADPAEKIARLRALRENADRRWIDSVDAAIRSLEEETRQ